LIRKYVYLLLLFSGLLTTTLSWATPPTSKIIAISGGPAWYHAGQTQTIALQPNFANTYSAITPRHVLATGELFLGLQRSLSQIGMAQLGLALAGSTAAQAQGDIWETADPAFDNFTYQYRITNAHVGIKTKWLFDHWRTLLFPYVSASLGVAVNQASRFAMTPLIFEALPVAGFQNHQETALTYTLGVGVHKIFDAHWQLGIGYEFEDWGRSSLGPAPGQTNSSGLSLNHLETQQLQFTINYKQASLSIYNKAAYAS